jgi:acetylornithine deacetylase/succinyl-diaminopimelate desuccinylase-like protein
VVEAKRSDWSFDPFVFREEGGFFYGRGTQDMKGDDAILVATFLRLKAENFRPARDMILALTSDEEGGSYNGVDWLVKNHRDLIDAEFCVNSDGGGGEIRSGKHIAMTVQAAEKVFLSFRLESTNPGGHSSLPTKDNAIYHLAGGLARLGSFDFPVHLFDVTRTELERTAELDPGQTGADMKAVLMNPNDTAAVDRLAKVPLYNALMRTTCVATMLSGGHAENALPQSASAVVNCRLLPPDDADQIEKTVVSVLNDPKIAVTRMAPPKTSPFIPINPKVMAAVTAATTKYWAGLPVIPIMSTGASDAVYLKVAGIPTYGVSGIFTDRDDVRAHGRDERILVKSFYDALPFMYDVVKTLGRD